MVSLCYYQAVIWRDNVMALSNLEGPGTGTVAFLLSLDLFCCSLHNLHLCIWSRSLNSWIPFLLSFFCLHLFLSFWRCVSFLSVSAVSRSRHCLCLSGAITSGEVSYLEPSTMLTAHVLCWVLCKRDRTGWKHGYSCKIAFIYRIYV